MSSRGTAIEKDNAGSSPAYTASPSRGGEGDSSRLMISNTPSKNSRPSSSSPRMNGLPDLDLLFISSYTGTHSGSSTESVTSVDPIDFLNVHYRTEQSLVADLPLLQQSIANRLNVLDESISTALSRQSETSERTKQVLPLAVASVQALQQRILLVKEKAVESEQAVHSITSDMKRLDCAKRNLQRTITTLKRLHMLVHAVEQLRQSTMTSTSLKKTCSSSSNSSSSSTSIYTFEPMDYRSAAQLVDATRLLLEYFEAYTTKVEPMKLLTEKVFAYLEILQQNLKRAFRIASFGHPKAAKLEEQDLKRKNNQNQLQSPGTQSLKNESLDLESESGDKMASIVTTPTPSATILEGGILLLDALGDNARLQFVNELCQDYLQDYVRDYEPPLQQNDAANTVQKPRVSSFKAPQAPEAPVQPLSRLKEMEKRFTWFQNVLLSVFEKFGMFPPSWNVQTSLSRHFLVLTRGHILALLDGPRKDQDASNTSVLLKAFQKTIIFEKDMSAWLENKCKVVFQSIDKHATTSSGNDYMENSEDSPVTSPPLIGVASAAFNDYMEPYVRMEEQSMNELLVEALEDRTVDTRGERPVFISSTKMFVTIKGSITRCTALTTGKPFYLLHLAFLESLRKYAQVLQTKLPTPVAPNTMGISMPGSFGPPSGSFLSGSTGTAPMYRLSKMEEVTVCNVISTCEYCAETLEALEDLIRETMDNEYSAKVNMLSEQEAFHEITAKAIGVLVSGLTVRCERGFKPFGTTNWGHWDAVGEESDYVRVMHEEIEPFVIAVRSLLPTSYFRSFCDKFLSSFTAIYYETLIRNKKISEPGTQQLLLDVYNLKTLFLRLPLLEHLDATVSPLKKSIGGGSTIAPAIYTKLVNSQFGRIETILKLVGTPNDLLIENFKVQWASGTSSDLQIVLSLKGVKRTDQFTFLEKFGVDSVLAMKSSTVTAPSAAIVSDTVQALQDQGSTVAAKVNSDLTQMRLKVDDFRKTWRTTSS